MCGIYGVFSKVGALSKMELEVFEQMGLVSGLRGMDSTGLFAVNKKNDVRTLKTLGPSCNLFFEKGAKKFMGFANSAVAMVGHTRSATIGSVTVENAHPFSEGHITMVHNGTIRFGLTSEADVDSHALTKDIEKLGVVKALHAVDGAYAVVLHDAKSKRVYLIRNDERPLHFVETSACVYIMSEGDALTYLLRRTKTHANPEPKSLLSKQIYFFDLESQSFFKEGEIPPKYTYLPPPAKVYSQQPYNTGSGGWGNKSQPTVGESVKFTVKNKLHKDDRYVFCGLDKDFFSFFFESSEDLSHFIGHEVIGRIVSKTWDETTKRYVFQIKTRSVALVNINLPDEDEDVLFKDGSILPKKIWKDLCENTNCATCGSKLDETSSEDCLFIEHPGNNYKAICGACVDDFEKNDPLHNEEAAHEQLKNLAKYQQ